MTLLLETTDVIIHTAAASDFGEPLADALKLNVLGTLQLLQIAKQMKHLALFLHVSSAYVNSFKVRLIRLL
jgi:fatty acyl-CoA reductase